AASCRFTARSDCVDIDFLPRSESPRKRALLNVLYSRNALAAPSSAEGIAADPAADLQLPLAAAAALYRPDRRAGCLCGAVSEGVVASVRPRLRFQRAADHAGGAGPDRRGDDFQPAGDGHRRRLR